LVKTLSIFGSKYVADDDAAAASGGDDDGKVLGGVEH
jgi:hypothetical protein